MARIMRNNKDTRSYRRKGNLSESKRKSQGARLSYIPGGETSFKRKDTKGKKAGDVIKNWEK